MTETCEQGKCPKCGATMKLDEPWRRNATGESKWHCAECFHSETVEESLRRQLSAERKAREAAEGACAAITPFVRMCRDDFDCDSDAHKYGTSCRACEASALIGENGEPVSHPGSHLIYELAGLRAKVAQLPLTLDNERIAPGMHLFQAWSNGTERGIAEMVVDDHMHLARVGWVSPFKDLPWTWCSTKEAAALASKAKDAK